MVYYSQPKRYTFCMYVHSTSKCEVTIVISELKACVCYFSLFLKEQCVSWLFWTKYFEKKFNLQLFYLPTVSQTFIFSELPCVARLLKTCFEKITACVIKTMLVTLPLVQMNKAQSEVSQQIKYKSK